MLQYWIWLALLEGISHRQKLLLLERFSSPEDIYHAARQELERLPDITAEAVTALENKDLTAARQVLSRCERKDLGIVTFGENGYPARLRNIPDPPLVLYIRGRLPDMDDVPVIGVVGTRKASAYGMDTARRMGAQIAQCGGLVVSGGAWGIDSAAMEGALEASSSVVGVLGCGADVVYPRNNGRLFARVTQAGCLISEYPPGTEPKPWHFPARNRIISGLSNGVLVVEAPEKSGALITARQALEQGRDVFVVPGNVDVASCVGSNALLREGGIAVSCGWDILMEYEALYPETVEKRDGKPLISDRPEQVIRVAQTPRFPEKDKPLPGQTDKKSIDKQDFTPYSVIGDRQDLTEEEQKALTLLTTVPCHADGVIARMDMPAGKALSVLTMLTLKGEAVMHPGNLISLKINR